MKLTPEILRLVRVNLGMSQAKLARKAGVSPGLIGMIERDDRPITPEVEWKLRKALGVTDEQIRVLVETVQNLKKSEIGEGEVNE